jgi:hypothetical protein
VLRAGAAPGGRPPADAPGGRLREDPRLGELGGDEVAGDATDIIDWLLLGALGRVGCVRSSDSAMCEATREKVGGVLMFSTASVRRPGDEAQ